MVLEVGPLANSHSTAGQFLQVKVGDSKPGFFAIASAPSSDKQYVELLVRSQPGSTAELICQAAVGSDVMASSVMGKGFNVDSIPPETCPHVLLFATGSGISPIKAVIESGVLQPHKRKSIKLYYGTQDRAWTAYEDLIPKWQSMGVEVRQVGQSVSRGGG